MGEGLDNGCSNNIQINISKEERRGKELKKGDMRLFVKYSELETSEYSLGVGEVWKYTWKIINWLIKDWIYCCYSRSVFLNKVKYWKIQDEGWLAGKVWNIYIYMCVCVCIYIYIYIYFFICIKALLLILSTI